MKKNRALTGTVLLLSLTLVFSSCKKNEDNTSVNTSTSTNEALADRIFDNVGNISDEAYSLETSTTKSTDVGHIYMSDCAIITLDTLGFPLTLTIDFGEENCLCEDGHYRRGQIIAHFTGRYRNAGTVITHTFNNYFVDDNGVEGTRVVTNTGPNADTHWVYQIEVNGTVYLANSNDSFSWISSRTREWIEGSSTYTIWDDVYLISGTSDGLTSNGDTWQRTTLEPLRKELGCKHFVSGIIEIVPGDRPVRTLDYGSGECDYLVTLTINGVVYSITLP